RPTRHAPGSALQPAQGAEEAKALRPAQDTGQAKALRPDQDRGQAQGTDRRAFRTALRLGAVVMLIAGIGVAVSGDLQSKVMVEVQPMKMAAAEALYETERPASFSILTIGTLDGQHEVFAIKIPYLLSFLSTGDPQGEVQGIRELQRAYEETYGPGSYAPYVPTTY